MEILEEAYKTGGKRKKYSLKRVELSQASWGATHEAASIDLTETLKIAVRLAYPKEDNIQFIFTDASDKL